MALETLTTFVQFLRRWRGERDLKWVEAVPQFLGHLVLGNLNIHCVKSLTDHFGKRLGRRLWKRLTVHYTPLQGSWLNQAEIELSLVSRQCLGTQRIAALTTLQRQTRAWTRRANHLKTTITWKFTRKDARRKFGYLAPVSNRSKT